MYRLHWQQSKGRRGARQHGDVGRATKRAASGSRKVLQTEMSRKGTRMSRNGTGTKAAQAEGKQQKMQRE